MNFNYGELRLPPEIQIKKTVSSTKGKSWNEIHKNKRSRKASLKALSDAIKKGRARSPKCGRKKRKCVAVDDDGRAYFFKSLHEAGRIAGIKTASNIIRSVKSGMKCAGLRWFYEDENDWAIYINNINNNGNNN